jgi:hypothetical protein
LTQYRRKYRHPEHVPLCSFRFDDGGQGFQQCAPCYPHKAPCAFCPWAFFAFSKPLWRTNLHVNSPFFVESPQTYILGAVHRRLAGRTHFDCGELYPGPALAAAHLNGRASAQT